jgi:hypothetical protein
MAGAFDVVTASTVEELEENVRQWYEDAADKGLEDERFPWDPSLVKQGDDGYEFMVWAHS